jgi:hypothetical protein
MPAPEPLRYLIACTPSARGRRANVTALLLLCCDHRALFDVCCVLCDVCCVLCAVMTTAHAHSQSLALALFAVCCLRRCALLWLWPPRARALVALPLLFDVMCAAVRAGAGLWLWHFSFLVTSEQ